MTVKPSELNHAKAPSLADLEALAYEAFAALPAEFRALCGDVVILVDDWPAADVLKELGIVNELELTGLYTGVALTQQDSLAPPRLPNTVHLYRVPLLLEWVETDVALGDLINHVIVHEIGHHFGLSDDDMHAIEDAD